MAVFGIPPLHEDDALRAVRAADEMRTALDDAERRARARPRRRSGRADRREHRRGRRRRPERRAALVTGDAVNVAARLEQAAAPGEILLGETTHRLVRDAVEVTPVEPLELKGKTEPVPAYRLVVVLADAAGHARHLDSPMVGRHKELELLEHALERAVTERTSHLFTLLGPAGVGKSRLVWEFVADRRTDGDGPARPVPVVRRGHHVLPARRGRAAGRGCRAHRRPREPLEPSSRRSLDGAEDRDRIVSLVAGLLSWGEPVATEDAFWARPQALRAPRARSAARRACSTTSTGRSRRSSTSSSTSPTGRATRRSCSCASRGPSCSRSARTGAAGR